jgi:hypothetical protein
MRTGRWPCLALILLLLSIPLTAAAEDEISVKVDIDRGFITIGDRINFRVSVVRNPHINVFSINVADALRDFEIKSSTDFSFERDGLVHEGKNFVITNYALGEYVIWPLAVEYRAGGGPVKTIESNSLYVTVQSIDENRDPDSDIRGVKSVLDLRRSWWLWLAFLALLAGVAGFFLWRSQKTKGNELGGRGTAQLTPAEEAYRALFRLKGSDYLKKSQYREYFFLMSEILKRYFERRYEIPALESTTFELMKELKSKTSVEQRKVIQSVLDSCDLVKFAKHEPSAPDVLKQNKQAVTIIDLTKPAEAIAAIDASAQKAAAS